MPMDSSFQTITFATSNINKFNEIQTIFQRDSNFLLEHMSVELLEIQSNVLEEVASYSLESIGWTNSLRPIFVEDSGLFIEVLNGFPGPYSSYVYQTIGLKGILSLMKGANNRKAIFKSVIALKYQEATHLCIGEISGSISTSKSNLGWGYDPIFIPDNMTGKTFGDLREIKNSISHRYLSSLRLIEKLAELTGGEY